MGFLPVLKFFVVGPAGQGVRPARLRSVAAGPWTVKAQQRDRDRRGCRPRASDGDFYGEM